jgi:uncharacterized protein (TIGR00369 family)
MSETRTRTIDFQDPSLTASGAVGKTGLEFLRDVISGKVPAAPLQATLGFSLVSVQDGFARIELVPGEHLFGPMNAVQSGLAATLLEAAMGAAVMTTLDAVTGYSTATLIIHSTRAITLRTSKVIAEGWVVHRGSRLVTAEARLNDADGRLLAHGSATCAISERPGA